jgi:uncharacterized protein
MLAAADFAALALLGLLGSAHCVGMCAPFALALGRSSDLAAAPTTRARALRLFARHLAYHLGKATAYVFIGVLILLATGWVDDALATTRSPLAAAQDGLALLAGLALALLGLSYLFAWRWPSRLAPGGRAAQACHALSSLWRSPSLFSCLLTGWLNGFLPCGLSLSALLYLASRDSLPGLVLGTYVFGLATLPGLFALGYFGVRLSPRLQGRGLRVVGLLLIVAGAFTAFRGHPEVHHFWHRLTVPGEASHQH